MMRLQDLEGDPRLGYREGVLTYTRRIAACSVEPRAVEIGSNLCEGLALPIIRCRHNDPIRQVDL